MRKHTLSMWLMCGVIVICAGCRKHHDEGQAQEAEAPCAVEAAADESLMPCPSVDAEAETAARGNDDPYGDIPRFAINSPFDADYESPVPEEAKRLWANSFLWEKAPELVVEKWLTDRPETAGRYVLIAFWATWCPPCRRSVALLNGFHTKYKDELVVIGVSDEAETDVRKLKEPEVQYYSAIDTQARTKKELGVFGIPHVILLEPDGYVVWEGFPLLKGYELTDEVIEHVLGVGRKLRQQQPAQ